MCVCVCCQSGSLGLVDCYCWAWSVSWAQVETFFLASALCFRTTLSLLYFRMHWITSSNFCINNFCQWFKKMFFFKFLIQTEKSLKSLSSRRSGSSRIRAPNFPATRPLSRHVHRLRSVEKREYGASTSFCRPVILPWICKHGRRQARWEQGTRDLRQL